LTRKRKNESRDLRVTFAEKGGERHSTAGDGQGEGKGKKTAIPYFGEEGLLKKGRGGKTPMATARRKGKKKQPGKTERRGG